VSDVEISAAEVVESLKRAGKRIVCAESCTGGLIAKLLTDVAGSSEIFWGGVVAYSNDAKEKLLGVDGGLIRMHGAVSEETARAMSEGALSRSGVEIAVSVTGIAGPGGGTDQKPVGTVYVGLSTIDGYGEVLRLALSGDRNAIRTATAAEALGLVLKFVRQGEILTESIKKAKFI
jgi:PncC family amidohydrolase